MSIAPLMLETLDPGTRVRADGDVIYVTEDFEIADGSEGTVARAWGVGASYVRWDADSTGRSLLTSHDSLQRA